MASITAIAELRARSVNQIVEDAAQIAKELDVRPPALGGFGSDPAFAEAKRLESIAGFLRNVRDFLCNDLPPVPEERPPESLPIQQPPPSKIPTKPLPTKAAAPLETGKQ